MILKVLTDRSVFDSQFEKQMRRVWGLHPSTTIKMVDRGLFLAECVNKRDFEQILNKGPWTYRQDVILATHCASPGEVNDSKLTHVDLWVQFHNVPLDTLTEDGVRRITTPIGTALSEPIPAHQNGKQYFRIKILLPVAEPVKDKLTIDHPSEGEVEALLVYEKVGRICVFCGSLGHEIATCSDRARLAKIKSRQTSPSRPELEGILKPTGGPWISDQTLIPQLNEEPELKGPSPYNAPKTDGNQGLKRAHNTIHTQNRTGGLKTATALVIPSSHTASPNNSTATPHSPDQNSEDERETVTYKRVKAANTSARVEVPLDQL